MKNWSDFLDMGGHGPYIWGSVLMCVAVVAWEIWALSRRRRALQTETAREALAAEISSSS